MTDIREQIRRLQNTERCYCGSQVIGHELKLVACLFHQSSNTMKKMLVALEEIAACELGFEGQVARKVLGISEPDESTSGSNTDSWANEGGAIND